MIWPRIHEWARLKPAKSAIVYNGEPIDYASFARAIAATHRYLQSLALPPGRTAIVLDSNPVDAWVLVLALRTLGLNTIAVESLAFAEQLDIADVACVAMSESERGLHNLKSRVLAGTKAIFAPKPVHAGIFTGDLPAPPETGPAFGGHILYTSGTTGAYKKVFLKGGCEIERNAVRARAMNFHHDSVHHGINYGLWTGAGFKQPAALWQIGGTIVVDDRLEQFDHFFEHGITSAAVLPPMVKILLDRQTATGAPSALGQVEFGLMSGFISLELAELAVRRLTRNFIIRYSATELIDIPLQSRFRSADDLHWLSTMEGCTVQIVNENGVECGADEEGELRIPLTNVDCDSYLGDAETSANVFRDGCFYPGDLAVKRADGRIRILGRTSDVLNVQGQKIAVAPLEQQIRDRLRASEVCLFSGLSDAGREELIIAVEADHEPPRAVMDRIMKEFSAFDTVRCITLKSFPRTAAGTRKIKRAALRQFVFAKSGAGVP